MSNIPRPLDTADLAAGQAAGAVAQAQNAVRAASEAAAHTAQHSALDEALAAMQQVRDFVGTPSEILGNPLTKHGEIAEQLEVGIRRARAAVEQQTVSAHNAAYRFDAHDIELDGQQLQLKFINGLGNPSLAEVRAHLDQYPGFASSETQAYMIPNDQHATIQRVLSGDESGLKKATVEAIKEHVRQIEETTGRPFGDVVKPASSDYADVQQGAIHDTLDAHDEQLHERSEERHDTIVQEHQPSWAEGLQTAAAAGAIAGGISLAAKLAAKYMQEDKNVFAGDFTAQDWKDVGLATAQGAAWGAATGGAVYVLTNFAGTAAPVAAAFAGAARGVGVLLVRHARGELSTEELASQALLVCADVGVAALGAAAGQALIPIPILGALIGSFAAKAAYELLARTDAAARLQQQTQAWRAALDTRQQARLAALTAHYLPLQAMADYAFDPAHNQRLQPSVQLAQALGVPPTQILHNTDAVRAYLATH